MVEVYTCDVQAQFKSPSGSNTQSGCSSYNDATGFYEQHMVLSEFSESGKWKVASIMVRDKVGNTRHYGYDDFPVSFDIE